MPKHNPFHGGQKYIEVEQIEIPQNNTVLHGQEPAKTKLKKRYKVYDFLSKKAFIVLN